MYGCTSDGSEDDLTLQPRRPLTRRGEAHTATQADLDTAEGRVTELEGDVTGLEGEVMTAEGERDAADLEVTRLEASCRRPRVSGTPPTWR